MSTYSPSLRIELITTGTLAGTWGTTTNDNLATVLDTAIAGYITVSVTAASQALTYLNGPTSTAAANQSVRAGLSLSTTTGANFSVFAPPVSKLYVIKNTSAYTATIYNSTVIGNTTAAGTGVGIPAGQTMTVWSDGTNFMQQNTALISPALSGTPTAPTASSGTNTTQVATTAFVASAISPLAPLASPALTGTPTAPTAANTVDNTQIATTAFVHNLMELLHPVGSVYINATSSTNPGTLFGFGTWVAFGAGRVPVGFDSANALFNVAEETGGSYDATVVSHTHSFSATTSTASLTGGFSVDGGILSASGVMSVSSDNYYLNNTAATGAYGRVNMDASHSHTVSGTTGSTGSSGTNANIQPYITVYMWKRTA